jgi:tellurite resistance protein TehA-like permease
MSSYSYKKAYKWFVKIGGLLKSSNLLGYCHFEWVIYEFFNKIRFYSLSIPIISAQIRANERYNSIKKFIWSILLRSVIMGLQVCRESGDENHI